MAPALRIPLSVPNMQEFAGEMEKAKSHVGQATRAIVQQFVRMNSEIGGLAAAGASAYAAQWTGAALRVGIQYGSMALAITAASKIIGAAIAEARKQLEGMLEIAERAGKSQVSPEFFQAFIAGAHGARETVRELEAALAHAFQATKEQLSPDWTVWDIGLKKVSAVEKAMLELRELFTTDQSFTGLDLFRGAGSQDQRILAVLTGMRELRAIGQQIAALDLGEKMFGAGFADQVRRGQIDIDKLFATITQKLQLAGTGEIISNSQILRAKELDDRLKEAHNTIEQNLKPSWESLNTISLRLLNTWTQIIEAVARATANIPKSQAEADQARRDAIASQQDESSAAFVSPVILRQRAKMAREGRLGTYESAPQGMFSEFEQAPPYPTGTVTPMPRPRPGPLIPQDAAKEIAETKDEYDRAVESIERHIKVLEADALAIGKTADEHERLRTMALLVAAAERAGIEVDEEKKREMEELADKVAKLRASLDQAKRAFDGINDAARFGGNELVNVLDRATQKGAQFGDIMADVLRNVSRQLIQAAITGEGAFAKMLGFNSTTGGVGGLLGLIVKGFGGATTGGTGPEIIPLTGVGGIGRAAEGGTIPPYGLSYVGEHGPNPRLIRAGSEPIMVTPNDIARGGGGSQSIHVSMPLSIDARGATPDTADAIVAAVERRVLPKVVPLVREAVGRGRI